ncbi:MAG TPA: hypothetical protein DCG75_03455 [Bacteroidales bacterium]|nr:hypothetical protein [Bacteroidales bacterium]
MLLIFKYINSTRKFISILLIMALIAVIGNKNTYSNEPNSAWIKHLYPDHYKVQFAGGIGFVSAGLGYDFFKERVDISYFYGYVPEWFSKEDLHSVSLQLTGKPFKIHLNSKLEYYPLNIGMFIHHTFGSEYYITLPDHYPEDYYWWSPGRTGGLFLEGQLNYQFKEPDQIFSEIGFYYRIVTRGVYLTSKISNTSIPLEDIFSLGLGIVIYY